MILELLLNPLFNLIKGLISLLPQFFQLPNWIADTISLIIKAMQVFPSDVWAIVIGNILFWIVVHFTWAIIEWVYKKIPGVN